MSVDNFTVFGAGQQGSLAIEKLTGQDDLPTEMDIDIDTIRLVDPSEEALEQASNESVESVSEEADKWLQHADPSEVEGVIYDAVDTIERVGEDGTTRALAEWVNNNNIEENELVYLSEKPTDPSGLQMLHDQGITISTDYIESFSAQKKSLVQDIRENNYDIDRIYLWRASEPQKCVSSERNLLKENQGAIKDKSPHDWSHALTLLEESSRPPEIEIFEEFSTYEVAHLILEGDGEYDRSFAFTESGDQTGIVNQSGERLNDGYSEITAFDHNNNVEILIASGLTGWPERIEDEMNRLEFRFEEELAQAGIEPNPLIYGPQGDREIRVGYVGAEDPETREPVEYLVSTGAEKFTLKSTENGHELLARGPNDWFREFQREGLKAYTEGVQPTIGLEASKRTSSLVEKSAQVGYESRTGYDEVKIEKGSDLERIIDSE